MMDIKSRTKDELYILNGKVKRLYHFSFCLLTNSNLYAIMGVQSRKGEIQMKKQYYVSKLTGEVVFTHQEAMELYRAGHEIEIWAPSKLTGEMLHWVDWVH